jgi:hypothetical protein
MDKPESLESNDDNIESPTTYGKDAYMKYRKKERLKEDAGTLGHKYYQKRTKVVMDTGYTNILAQLLKDLKFPVAKSEVIKFVLRDKSSTISRVQATDVLSLVQQVEEREYKSVFDLIDAVGLLKDVS